MLIHKIFINIFGKNFVEITNELDHYADQEKILTYKLNLFDYEIGFDFVAYDTYKRKTSDFLETQLVLSKYGYSVKENVQFVSKQNLLVINGKNTCTMVKKYIENLKMGVLNTNPTFFITPKDIFKFLGRYFSKVNQGYICDKPKYGMNMVVYYKEKELEKELEDKIIKELQIEVQEYLNVPPDDLICKYNNCKYKISECHPLHKSKFPYVVQLQCCKTYCHRTCVINNKGFTESSCDVCGNRLNYD